jgi:branched-chain amino acid transport system substrate-binding protein
LKKIVFLIIASLLVIGLVLPGCTGGPTPTPTPIKVLIVGPMQDDGSGNNIQFIEGRHMWWGAQLAASEINALNSGNGFKIGSNYYQFELVQVDDKEMTDPLHAGDKLNTALSSGLGAGAQYIIGGFATQAVEKMIPVAMANDIPFFIDGASNYSLLSGTIPYQYDSSGSTDLGDGTPYYLDKPSTSGGYKYIFRGSPMNDVFLANSAFLMTTMVAKRIEGIIGASLPDNPVRIAILAEDLPWATQWVNSARQIFGAVAPGLGWPWQLVGTWRVSTTATAAQMSDNLTAINATKPHIIFTVFAGAEGVTFAQQKGALGIPAMAVGMNLRAQYPTYWTDTQYDTDKFGADYEISLATWAPGVAQTSKTTKFLTDFQTTYKEFPILTAASYDILWGIEAAMLGAQSTAPTAVISWYEGTANPAPTDTTGQRAYYPQWDGTTTGKWMWTDPWDSNDWPALDTAAITHFYDTSYNPACNFTMAPYTTHDLVYGPTWEIGVGIQWHDGSRVGVWPNNSDYLTDQNTMSRAFAGIDWTAIPYTGTSFVIPGVWITTWQSWS